jgi:hypothetical protein
MFYTFIKHQRHVKEHYIDEDPQEVLKKLLEDEYTIEYTKTEKVFEKRITVYLESPEKAAQRYQFLKAKRDLNDSYIQHLSERIWTNIQTPDEERYYQFHIPKHSGGIRTITAPTEDTMQLQRELLHMMQHKLKMLPHTSAHAYSKGRSTVTAMKLHQMHKNYWFTKVDLKDFFPSFRTDNMLVPMMKIYPLGFLITDLEQTGLSANDFMKFLTYNNELPQGAPTSPFITNMMMVPFDYAMTRMIKSRDINATCYTRYADDLLLSGKTKPDLTNSISKIKLALLENNLGMLQVNEEKTRLGSRAGRNWNLGIMLNEQNELSIGHRNHDRFRAMLFNLLTDWTKDIHWDKISLMKLQGLISYYNTVEPKFVQRVLEKYSEKLAGGRDFHQILKQELNRPL